MKCRNISMFISHLGCPHNCIFCDQKSITGAAIAPSSQDILKAVEIASKQKSDFTELAFFGGSFTAIDRDYMISLLETAKRCIDNGDINGIRISTRPDYIYDEVLDILKKYGVTSIELGAQSMQQNVLDICQRGHTSEDVVTASEKIKEYGFSLGLQMMTGLPYDSIQGAFQTAEELANLNPDTMRIYPAVTLKGTLMGDLYISGEYKPPEFEESVAVCSQLLLFFESRKIPVIKLGLQQDEQIDKNYLAGAYHPAFREICENQIYLELIRSGLSKFGVSNEINNIMCAKGEISKLIGHKRKNKELLNSDNWKIKVMENEDLKPFTLLINGRTVR